MSVLLTGANGFVGRATLAHLQAIPGTQVHLALRQLLPAAQGCAQHLVGDIGRATDWSAALRGMDTVVHLAARVHVMNEQSRSPLAAFREVNTQGSLNLARQAAAQGVKRLVYISSVKVHGEATAPGQTLHEGSPTAPVEAYGISKLEAEQGLREIASQTGLQVCILRPPLVYGPGVGANFQALMRAVQRGVPLPLGAVHNQRSLVAVDNLASAITLCSQHPQAANQTFLVSDQQDMSSAELIRQLAQAMRRPARLLPVPVAWLRALGRIAGKSAAIDRLCGNMAIDSSRISQQLGWQPAVDVAEGLRRAAAGLEAH